MDSPSFNVLSLFSGAGGLDLGIHLARAGHHAEHRTERRSADHRRTRTVCFVEREAYAAAILAARMEDGGLDDAPIWSDVVTFDGRPWRGVVDCVTGGFPCQDISLAGKGAGIKEGTRSGLWFEYARIIREVGPRFVFVENVAALARRGLDIVLGDLAALGFDAEWGVFSAAEAGAPHRRERLFILAYRLADADGDVQPNERQGEISQTDGGPFERRREFRSGGSSPAMADADSADHRNESGRSTGKSGTCSTSLGDDGPTVANAESGGALPVQQPRRLRSFESEGEDLADADGLRRDARIGNVHARQPDAERRGECVADTLGEVGRSAPGLSVGGDGSREVRIGSEESGRCVVDVGHTDDAGLEGRSLCGLSGADQRSPWPPGGAFPPGPGDADGWREYLSEWPELEPAICRGADGLADRMDRRNRIDRLRACGNGVVPQQAALAWRTLWARAFGERAGM